ncbi:MAG: hypothetical protein DMF74_16020 [Acidobacteria bacterium]|nr:MAG: hypothetical protein DMF74_16020 [Acidobacteriota bacterium]
MVFDQKMSFARLIRKLRQYAWVLRRDILRRSAAVCNRPQCFGFWSLALGFWSLVFEKWFVLSDWASKMNNRRPKTKDQRSKVACYTAAALPRSILRGD